MKSLSSLIVLCGMFAMVIIPLNGDEENRDIDKRYLAALAKNGRLPKFASAQKKDQSLSSEKVDTEDEDSKEEDKRHVGAFLKTHGKPNWNRYGNQEGKRNVASMARLGRLNAIRFARLQPYNVGGKRMSSEETSNNDEDNAINIFMDPDCLESEESVDDAVDERPIWMQKKRYVAALARSGRLPIWHSQRMWWGGKRDDSRPNFSSSRFEDSDHGDNTLDGMSFVASKNKRCKKVYDDQMEKRNIASLARNGKLPFRSYA